MKKTVSQKTLSLILAALLLASNMVSCGNGKAESNETSAETVSTETKASETAAFETDSPETETSAIEYVYDTSLITENGVAKAHVVLPDGASAQEKLAAEELVYHIKLVTGADISVVNTAQADSLPMIIATPDSLPELEELFPEDLAWLRTTEENNEDGEFRRWADDGFSIRAHEGKIYIFGATAVGALNGTYDFIEENLDVIWVGGTDAGIIYNEMPTITAVKTNYREKSPFTVSSKQGNGVGVYYQRNKQYIDVQSSIYGPEHSVKSILIWSPIYDPNIDEYWETEKDGTPLSSTDSLQVNYWSQLTADTVAAGVIDRLDSFTDENRPLFFNVGMEDVTGSEVIPKVYPEVTEPFEYAPGQFVNPDDSDYITTVYYTFINRVARKVAEKYPDVTINTLTYMWSIAPPRCELEPNVSIWFCPIEEDYTIDSYDEVLAWMEEGYVSPSLQYVNTFEAWHEEFPETVKLVYNYYFCYHVAGYYERPIWYKLQNDFQYFAEHGVIGSTICAIPVEGYGEIHRDQNEHNGEYAFTYGEAFDLNRMTLWIYYKLMWNPWEDVDALIAEYCDKVYGEASDEMQEYYALLYNSWHYVATEVIPYEFNAHIGLGKDQFYYMDYFLDIETPDGVYVLDGLKDALSRAWEAADDRAKEFIRYPYELFQNWEKLLG